MEEKEQDDIIKGNIVTGRVCLTCRCLVPQNCGLPLTLCRYLRLLLRNDGLDLDARWIPAYAASCVGWQKKDSEEVNQLN